MGVRIGDWSQDTIYTLLFADDQIHKNMEFMVRTLLEEYEKWGLKINLEKTFYIGCGAETKHLKLEDQKGFIRGCEEFEYLWLKIDKEDWQENYIESRINNSNVEWGEIHVIIQSKHSCRLDFFLRIWKLKYIKQ